MLVQTGKHVAVYERARAAEHLPPLDTFCLRQAGIEARNQFGAGMLPLLHFSSCASQRAGARSPILRIPARQNRRRNIGDGWEFTQATQPATDDEVAATATGAGIR
jgi:hypothetical protein